MDVSNASYYKQENNENKGSQMGHTQMFFFLNKISSFLVYSFKSYLSKNLLVRNTLIIVVEIQKAS